jgi:hypothetical protein
MLAPTDGKKVRLITKDFCTYERIILRQDLILRDHGLLGMLPPGLDVARGLEVAYVAEKPPSTKTVVPVT